MSQPVVLRRLALLDVVAAHEWYEAQRLGLGAEFETVVDAAVERIGRDPDAYEVVEPGRGVRRTLTRRFPYALYYLAEPDRLVVIAVLHVGRDPSRWRSRP